MKIKTLSHFQNLQTSALMDWIKSNSSKVSSQNLEIGKALVALDKVRDGKGTLKKFVRAECGAEIPDHAFSCARVFGDLVGTGYGTITETDYDTTALRWLLQASAILGLMEKQPEDPEIREKLCAILRDKPADGYSQLEAMKKALKPEKQDEDGAAGDGGEAENVTALPYDPILAIKTLGAFVAQSEDHETVSRIQTAILALQNLVDLKAADLAERITAKAA